MDRQYNDQNGIKRQTMVVKKTTQKNIKIEQHDHTTQRDETQTEGYSVPSPLMTPKMTC